MISFIKKGFKKYLSSILLLFCMTVTVSSYGDTVPAMSSQEVAMKSEQLNKMVKNEFKPTSLEEYQKDLTNRMILGVFGKDALIFSLPNGTPDSIKNEINGLSLDEMQHYSAPFNIRNLSGLLMIYSSFFFIAITVLAIYMVWVFFEGLFNTQDSGIILGKRTNLLFSVLKSTSALALIVPSIGFSHKPFSDFDSPTGNDYGSYSLSQWVVFKVVGESNLFANYIWGSFINAYQKAYPSIGLPNTNSKELEMENILKFAICVKEQNKGTPATVTFSSKNGQLSFNSFFNGCELNGKLSYDKKTLDAMSKSEELKNAIGNVNIESYNSIYESELKTLVLNAFQEANKYADLIITERYTPTTSKVTAPLLVTPINWYSLCDKPKEMFKSGETSIGDTYLLEYYYSKCMSKNFILSYLSKDKEKAISFYNTNVLKNKTYPICNSDAALNNGQRTYVETDNSIFKNGLEVSLKDCIQKTCGDLGSGSTGIYQCLSSLEFAKSNIESRDMVKQGWINAGAYSYVLFSGFKNKLSREMVSSFTTTFNEKGKNTSNNTTGISLTSIPSKNTLNKDLTLELLQEKEHLFAEKIDAAKKDTSLLETTAKAVTNIIGGEDGLFGITKFITCTKSPDSITDNFMCGNVTEEMHDFGSKMLAFSLEMKTAQSLNRLLSKSYSNKSKENATLGNADSVTTGFISTIFKGVDNFVNIFGRSIGANITLGNLSVAAIIGGGIAASDAFGNDGYWMQDNETYLILIGLMANHLSFVGDFLDFFVGFLMILGVIFGFILPLLPYFLWLTVIIGWIIMILECLVILPVWAATLVKPSNTHTTETAKRGLLFLLTVIMRAPFLVVGLVLAWMLSNVLIGEILQMSNISDALLLQQTGGLTSILDALVKLIVYLALLYLIYNLVFSIIEGFYEIGSNWLFGGALSPFATKDRSENWRKHYKATGSFLGVKV